MTTNMSYPAQVHLVRKSDISQHATVEADFHLPPLAAGSVRAKPNLLGLTLMNRAYAQLGTVLHWWSAFPPPSPSSGLPSPYREHPEEWGIVPCWGFAEVVESQNAHVQVGAVLFGMWPSSTLPVDLHLRREDEGHGHFLDHSPHRVRIMPVYNLYQAVDPSDDDHPEELRAWEASALTVWGAGWLLGEYTFSPDDEGRLIPPTGEGHWDDRDADLSSAVVVTLGAASKAARGFSWTLSRRDPSTGPLTLLEVTSSKEDLRRSAKSKTGTGTDTGTGTIESHIVSYNDSPRWRHAEHYIYKKQPNRILLVDFGSPPGVAQSFHDHIMASAAAPSTFSYLRVGVGPDPLTSSDPRTRTHILNTGPLMEAAIKADGLEAVYAARREAFRQWLGERGMGGMELLWGRGVAGQDGIEGAWDKMFDGTFPRQKALVFRI